MDLFKNAVRPSTPILNNLFRSLIRYPLFRFSSFYTGRNIYSELSKINKYYKLKSIDQDNLTKKYLINILQVAKKAKFYSERITNETIEKINTDFGYLNDIPLTTKEDLLNYPEDFFTEEYNIQNLIRSNTNGSQGPSAAIFYDQAASDCSSAITWYCRSFYEKFYKNTTLHFAADLQDNSKPLPALVDWLRFFSTNRFNLFISSLDNSSNEMYFENVLGRNYQLVHSHPSTIYHLALYAKENNIQTKGLFKFFESSGEKLFDYQKKVIKDVFNCKVIDRYGFAESGIVAYELPFFEKFLTIMRHHCFIENSKNNNDDLIITNFNNRIFPLIRYRNGDKIITEDATIPKFIKEIKGREHSVHLFGETRLNTTFIMDILSHSLSGILDFQVKPGNNPKLYIALEENSDLTEKLIYEKLYKLTAVKFEIIIQKLSDLKKKGLRNKFSHII